MSFTESAQDMRDELVQLRHSLHTTTGAGPGAAAHPGEGARRPRRAAAGDHPRHRASARSPPCCGAAGRGRPCCCAGTWTRCPSTERNDLPYASQIDGRMHACGHDLHTAMLAGAAHLLSARRERAGRGRGLHVPARRGGLRRRQAHDRRGGAGRRRATPRSPRYGMHVRLLDPAAGGVHLPARPDHGGGRRVHRDGHGAGRARLHAAPAPRTRSRRRCEMVTALQTMVTRTFDVFDPVVVTVGSFHAGHPATTSSRTRRASRPRCAPSADEQPGAGEAAAVEVVEGIAAAHGLGVEASFGMGYPVTVNDPTEADFAGRTADALFGPGRYFVAPQPITGLGGLLVRAGGGAGRVRLPRRLPAGPRPGDRGLQPLAPRRSSTTRCCPTAPRSTPRSRTPG